MPFCCNREFGIDSPFMLARHLHEATFIYKLWWPSVNGLFFRIFKYKNAKK